MARRVGVRRPAAGVLVASVAAALVLPSTGADADPPSSFPVVAAVTKPGPVTGGNVPEGVCAVTVTVLGAAGGHNMIGNSVSAADANGAGAQITATFGVVPGEKWSGTVGGGGVQGETGGQNGGGAGGKPKSGHAGSGGGGWSGFTLNTTDVIVAGGGGGSGGGHSTAAGFGGSAGLPTAAGVVTPGQNGTNGRDDPASNVVGGGGGGSATAPGAGGANSGLASAKGTNGSGRTGGAGGPDPDYDSGGGGGGGYYGGGGGASTAKNGTGAPTATGVSGAGGGGGSSFVAATSPDGTNKAVSGLSAVAGPKRSSAGNGADGSLSLTWIPCKYDLSLTKTVNPASAVAKDKVTWTITVTNSGPDPMLRGDVLTINDSNPYSGSCSGIPNPCGLIGAVTPGTKITSVSTSGGTAPPGVDSGAMTCDKAVGSALGPNTAGGSPVTVTCSRPYAVPGAGALTPAGGTRGLNVGETLTITYEQQFGSPIPTEVVDVAKVADTTDGDTNDSVTRPLRTTAATPPTTTPDTSAGNQGDPQSAAVLANDSGTSAGTLTLIDADGNVATAVTIPGQGTYTIDKSTPSAPRIVFTPLPDFTGPATPVTYRVASTSGGQGFSTYAPTVNPVTAPDTTSGPQGVAQTADVLANDNRTAGSTLDPASLKILNAAGTPVASYTVAGEGTYSVVNGKIVFTPLPTFTGRATPITYTVNDQLGNAVRNKYTATLIPVAPELGQDSFEGIQGKPQSADLLANDKPGDPAVPLVPSTLTLLDASGKPATTVPAVDSNGVAVGTYVLANGVVTFTPNKDFVGEPVPVSYRVADANGTVAISTFEPRVLPVTPTATADTTTGTQGAPQSSAVLANDAAGNAAVPLDPATLRLLDVNNNPITTLTVAGEGTYTIDRSDAANPKLVFTPLPTFFGTATTVNYQVADANGTIAKSTYTPTVTQVARPDTSSGPQGVLQTADVLANDNLDPAVTPDPTTLKLISSTGAAVNTLTVAGQGTYTVLNGKITFQPLPGFVGTATPVTYQVSDQNGNPIQSTYTPSTTRVTPTATNDTATGPQGLPVSAAVLANDSSGNAAVPFDPATLTLLDASNSPVTTLTVAGQGTYSIDRSDPADPKVVFTPLPTFKGTATPATYRVANANGTTVTATFTPTLTPVTPTAKADTSTGTQGDAQTVDPVANDTLDPTVTLDPTTLLLVAPGGNTTDTLVIDGQGTYTVADGKIVFTPLKTFTGTATPVAYQVKDGKGFALQDTVAVTVTAVKPTATDDKASGPQGLPVSSAVLANDKPGNAAVPLDPSSLVLLDAGQPVTTLTIAGQGTYTIDTSDAANPKLVFTPLPTFTGTATPATYRVADVNGTTATATYTPTLTAVTPKASPDKTTGPQGAPQSSAVLGNDQAGDAGVPLDPSSLTLLDAAGKPVTTLTIAGQGTYSVERSDPADPRIVFTPLPGYTGTATAATYQVADKNGTLAKSTYTPTVTPVTQPDTSTGVQGVPQSVDPTTNDTLTPGRTLNPQTLQLIDPTTRQPVTSITVAGQGTYSVANGMVTFTPLKTFVGTATPVTYQAFDQDGNALQDTYTPTVTKVTPVANPDARTGLQGLPVASAVLANDRAGDPDVPLDPDSLTLLNASGQPVTTLTIPGQGTYSIDRSTPDAPKVVFTPTATFTGKATPVTYRIADVNGTTASSTYSPTLTDVAPVAADDKSTGPQGAPQRVLPLANDKPGNASVPIVASTLKLLDPKNAEVDTVTVPGQGTYTIDRTDPTKPAIVFTPLPDFVGTAGGVSYTVQDVNGTATEATYVPTVTDVTQPDTSTGAQGLVQRVSVVDNDDLDPSRVLDPGTLTLIGADGKPAATVTIAGEGTYSVSNGQVVFTPLRTFIGTAKPVTYQVKDQDGNALQDTYTPTVQAVKPVALPDEKTGPQGVPVSVNPLANDAAGNKQIPLDPSTLTLVDAAGNPVTTIDVPGQGTYSVDTSDPAAPLLVFTPLKTFTGEATPARYRISDENGTDAFSTYTPTLSQVVPTASPDTSTGTQGAVQRVNPVANDKSGNGAVALDPSSLTLLDADTNAATDTVVVPGEGTYRVDRSNASAPVLTFTPLPEFTGSARPVTYRIADVNGTTDTSTYTPDVTPVTAPDTSRGPQGVPQTIDVLANDTLAPGVKLDPATLQLVDPATGTPGTTVTVAGEGTYTVSAGKVVFTPEKGFVGKGTTLDYRVRDTDGNTLQDTVTATTTLVVPTAAPDTASGPQGRPVSVDPLANDKPGVSQVPLEPATLTLLDDKGDPVGSVTVAGEGTYTIDRSDPAKPLIVFTPTKTFVGPATPVGYQVADANGTTTSAKYTPTLTKATPVAANDTSSGSQGAPQIVDVLGNDKAGDKAVPLDPTTLTLLDPDDKPVDTVEVPGQGTYSVDRSTPSAPKIVFTPLPGFAGPVQPVTYSVQDINGTPTTATLTPTVRPDTQPDTTSGPQGVPQRVDPLTNDNLDPTVVLDPSTLTLIGADGTPAKTVDLPGVGTYSIDNGELVFTPVKNFVGTVPPVTYQVADTKGNLLQDTYTPSFARVTPTATDDKTSGPQGVPQSSAVLANDSPGTCAGAAVKAGVSPVTVRAVGPCTAVPLAPETLTLLDSAGQPVDTLDVIDQGTYSIDRSDPAAPRIVFTPLPKFVGTADPVTYQVANTNGTTTTATYTPTFTKVTPTASRDTSTGTQGAVQTVDPFANDKPGSSAVPLVRSSLTLLDPLNVEVSSLDIPGEGTYAVSADGTITFTPLPQFQGTPTPIGYRIADANGTTADSVYAPTVTPVTDPDSTIAHQGVVQRARVLGNDTRSAVTLVPSTLVLIDPATGAAVSTLTVPNEGTYTVSDGQLVFTPLPQFVTTQKSPATAVTYQVLDSKGNVVQSTYTPNVTAVKPGPEPDFTSGPQGRVQRTALVTNDKPSASDVALVPSSVRLLDADGVPVDSDTVTVAGEGTYTLDRSDPANPVIVFTPVAGFTGIGTKIGYRILDVNGTGETSYYQATVNAVVPAPRPDVSKGVQGRPQSVSPLANDRPGDPSVPLLPSTLTLVDPKTGDLVSAVTVPGQGTYTIDASDPLRPKIVFVPVPSFVGVATPVTYQISDVNGVSAKSTYTPTVVGVGPLLKPDTSSGPYNKAQSANPLANDRAGASDVPLDPDSLTLLDAAGRPTDTVTVAGQGTYRLVNGRIVFTPVPGFFGTAKPVTYRVADVNGTTATSTYTPTVAAPKAIRADITKRAVAGSTVVFDIAAKVPTLEPSSLRLVGPGGKPVQKLVVPHQGTWTVDTGTGKITFAPEPGFTGDPTPVDYTASTVRGAPIAGTLRVDYYQPAAPPHHTPASTGIPWLPWGVGLALALLVAGAAVTFLGRRRLPGRHSS